MHFKLRNDVNCAPSWIFYDCPLNVEYSLISSLNLDLFHVVIVAIVIVKLMTILA